jgi:zinc protease
MQTLKRSINHQFVIFFLALVCAALSLPAAAAITLPKGVKEVTEVQGITEYQLESNGLRILLAPDDSKPTTTVNMTYLVGSRHENYGQTGMAHLLEHMLFKGTPTIRNALAEFSRRGLQANGSTSTDRTNYYASFAANPETLNWYLGWQADAMVNSLIAREDLDTEMTVVRNEMESGENNPFRILWQKMLGAAYQWHNYGKTPIGARSDVEGVDIAQLQAFYRLYYQPDNAVLTIAGKFNPESALQHIVTVFGPIPQPTRALPKEYTVEPVQDGERRVILRRTGGSPLVAGMYHIPPGAHPDYAAIDLATMMLSDTPSGRLYKAMVPQGLATNVFGFSMDQFDPGTVMFGAELELKTDQEKAMMAMNDAVQSITKTPFTEEELVRARSQWLKSWDRAYADPQRVGTIMSEAIAMGDWRMFFKQREQIEATTLADVQRVAQAYFLPSNRTEGMYIPTDKPVRAPVVAQPDLKAMLQDFHGDQQATTAASFDPSPSNIDARTERKVLNLPNGPVSLALLPKDTRGERVTAEIVIRFGDLQTLKGKALASTATASLIEMGTDKLSRQQIQDRIDALAGDMSISGSGTSVRIGMTTTQANIDALMALAFEVVRGANFPQDQVTEFVAQRVTDIKASMTEPTALASYELSRYDNPWPKDDIRYTPSFEESIADLNALKREDLVAFHKQFYGAGQMSVVMVGEFDPITAEKTITDGLKGWQRAPKYVRIEDPYRAIAPTTLNIQTPDKANAFLITTLPLKLQDDNADYPALVLANFMLGRSETSRLWNRIREQDGLSYNVRSTLSISAFEPSGSWTIFAIFAPENRGRLENALNEELARVVKDGFTEAEVKSAQQAYLNLRALGRAQDGALVRAWTTLLHENRTFEWSKQFDEHIAKLTPDTINQAVKQYLKPEGFTRAVAGDFK